MTNAIVAETHGSEYLIHKYWSRKPANVIRQLIETYSVPGDVVIDPFCGSGVTLIESLKLGRSAVGIDVNPTAVLISSVSTSSHDLGEVRRCWNVLLERWAPACRDAFFSPTGGVIKHCVHTALLKCLKCGRATRADQCVKKGNRYLCASCRDPVNTSIAHAQGTEVVGVQPAEGDLSSDARLVKEQSVAANARYCSEATVARFNARLLHNTRILSYPGMTVSTLFTPRNFSLLCRFAAMLHDEPMADKVRDVLLLVFTSAVASCSRLIPFRGNMEGGGPAWTVPGFWVPPVHLERNPLHHLTARYAKVEKGLASLARTKGSSVAKVLFGSSDAELEKLKTKGVRANYIFADPPYGDSVPFLEFSQVWNCWETRRAGIFDQEVVVSDRVESKADWEVFRERLGGVIAKCEQLLVDDGKLTLTFNSLDLKAWKALLDALQNARFRCLEVAYQLPAVVSAKASFAPTSSYLGDVYATFGKAAKSFRYRAWDVVEKRLVESITMRQGAVGRVTQLKVSALTILAENVKSECLLELDKHFASLPTKTPLIPEGCKLFCQMQDALVASLRNGKMLREPELCSLVVGKLPSWIGLDQHEIIDVARRIGLRRTKAGWQSNDAQKHLFSKQESD